MGNISKALLQQRQTVESSSKLVKEEIAGRMKSVCSNPWQLTESQRSRSGGEWDFSIAVLVAAHLVCSNYTLPISSWNILQVCSSVPLFLQLVLYYSSIMETQRSATRSFLIRFHPSFRNIINAPNMTIIIPKSQVQRCPLWGALDHVGWDPYFYTCQLNREPAFPVLNE